MAIQKGGGGGSKYEINIKIYKGDGEELGTLAQGAPRTLFLLNRLLVYRRILPHSRQTS